MPIRTCIVTREKAEKSAFFRFTVQNYKLVFDFKKTEKGRGGYVRKDADALEKLKKLGGKICYFLKVSKIEIEDEVIERQKECL